MTLPAGAAAADHMDEAEFMHAFETATLPNSAFRHADHVRLAWLYLRQRPLREALPAFCEGLKRYAAANARPGLYHETITWAYLLLIHQRREGMGRDHSWEDFTAANPDLLDWKNSILKRYYCEATLESDFARRVFVLPDRGLRAPD